ncbi:Oxysterol-binding protein [Caenorhabditis elegans]|nr:Oxysterol-binding protein [Caenorhabditis elegans]CCD31139.1 Oxysterol-binding protein [Caenorhabditis elegans]|eukprot:NP_001255117.1 Oxysterol-binding protein [Caenorhabditis elegans]
MSSTSSGKSRRAASLSSINNFEHLASVEKAGWLNKWTNYLKGYRQRWFVLDSNATLSYYRNPSEVGHTCRGSINLQEARVHTDKTTSCIVISGQSQTFHVKPQNEMDRQQWTNSLEYMRHKAITRAESEEDEDAQMAKTDSNRSDALILANRQMSGKLCDLRTAANMMNKQGDELMRALNGTVETDKNSLAERADLLKMTTSAVLQAAEEFVELSEQSAKRLNKIVAVEQKEKALLQEQLEALAKQHSSLERAASKCARGAAPVSVYSDQEDDEFHDAEEDLAMPCSNSNGPPATAGVHLTPTKRHIGAGDPSSSTCSDSGAVVVVGAHKGGRQRRTTVPERPNLPINLWSIMKNCIGKELSKIPMPVNFSEPISVLQRVTEDLEYANLLETGAKLSTLEQMCYVAAYAASNYSTTCHRTNKPFNPLLGETFEFDRMDDLGWRSVTEQVSHHPPAAAHHAEGNGWTMYQDFTMTSRFRGKYLSVIPIGFTHVVFPATKSHFSYRKITTTVHNIIVGKLWIDNHGDMEITNHETNEKCLLKFVPYSYFSREQPRKVYGIVRDAEGIPKYVVQGTWDKSIDMLKVSSWNGNHEKPKLEVDETSLKRIWTANPLPKNAEKMHNFTKLAIELNEPEEGVAPTDSRLRPDQRLMENGEWDEANRKKLEIEEKQRVVRRRREAEKELAMKKGDKYEEYEPTWFVRVQDESNGALIHQFKGGYWEAKEQQNWEKCPDIF